MCTKHHIIPFRDRILLYMASLVVLWQHSAILEYLKAKVLQLCREQGLSSTSCNHFLILRSLWLEQCSFLIDWFADHRSQREPSFAMSQLCFCANLVGNDLHSSFATVNRKKNDDYQISLLLKEAKSNKMIIFLASAVCSWAEMYCVFWVSVIQSNRIIGEFGNKLFDICL